MNIDDLRRRFRVPGVTFSETGSLTFVHVATGEAAAAICLQGAHLTAWQPAGFEPMILLSHKSEFAPGKPIRGGVPIVFPWFAGDRKPDRIDGHPGPSHGFARIQDWTLDSVARRQDAAVLTFSLGPTPMSRAMGYDRFLLRLEFRIGRELRMALTVTNTGEQPLAFEEGFHTYFEIADIHEVSIAGLEPTGFIDKNDAMRLKPASGAPIQFSGATDRVYNGTAAAYTIHDVAGRRNILLEKAGSNSTVVWNPFAPLSDLGEWDWHEMVAVETCNVGPDSITLARNESHTMSSHVTVKSLGVDSL